MKKPTLMWLALVMVALLLGGCHPPNYNPPGGGNAAVWIEFPADGQILPDQPVPFVVYATDDGGVTGISLKVNGMTLPVQAPTRLSPDGYMVRLDQTWQPLPPVEGQYTLTASNSGISTSVTFCMVSCQTPPEVETGPNQSQPYIAITPTATLPFITLPPDAPTNTSTPTPYSESSVEFWAAPPYVNSGACTSLNWNVSGDFQAIYYEGALVNTSGSRTECPLESRNYQLQVVGLDNRATDYAAFVEVYQTDSPTATKTKTPLPPPTRTPTPTMPPALADTNGPTINYVTHIWEGCTIFGEAGITDSSGVAWAEFWFNHNETGWSWIKMNKSGDRWVSQVGIETGGFAGSLVYKVRTEDALYNESWSGEITHNYAYCGE